MKVIHRLLFRPPALIPLTALVTTITLVWLDRGPSLAAGIAIGLIATLAIVGLVEALRYGRRREEWRWAADAVLFGAIAVAGPTLDASPFFRAHPRYVFFLGISWLFALGVAGISAALKIWAPPPTDCRRSPERSAGPTFACGSRPPV